jgi:hypothetical protein
MSEPARQTRAQNTEDEPAVFVAGGPDRWVRHPWYLVAIMLLVSCVDFTSDHRPLNVLWNDWVCLGKLPPTIIFRACFLDQFVLNDTSIRAVTRTSPVKMRVLGSNLILSRGEKTVEAIFLADAGTRSGPRLG